MRALTGNSETSWAAYTNSRPDGTRSPSVGSSFYRVAKEAIPIYELKAKIPERKHTESMWMTIIKGKAREDREEREAAEREYERRVKEAREAQRVLELLKDEEVLSLFL